jgi:hypothetical protein
LPARATPAAADFSWVVREQAMERTFGFIMLGVLIVVAFLGFHYSH